VAALFLLLDDDDRLLIAGQGRRGHGVRRFRSAAGRR
jgi:hypothetical protein